MCCILALQTIKDNICMRWNKAEAALRQAVRTLDVEYEEELGEAAFYGPKIDFVVKDVIGREWQLGPVQVDYNLPERFDLSYVGSDNQDHRPVMIHRAPFGSMERFCGLLIEHFAGNFPTWLAPEQVRILPMNDDLVSQADECAKKFTEAGIRTGIDRHAAKVALRVGAVVRGERLQPRARLLGGADAAVRAPLGLCLDEARGALYVTTGRGSHRVLSVSVHSRAHRRRLHIDPIVQAYLLRQKSLARLARLVPTMRSRDAATHAEHARVEPPRARG